MSSFVENDGGRAAAGFKGHTGDCVCRAIAIATELPYAEVYALINGEAQHERPGARRRRRAKRSSARTGVYKRTVHRMMTQLGWVWTPTMSIGSGCKVHLRADELPPGRLVVSVSHHEVAVIDGVVHDTYDSTRGGTRCVYGYWSKPSKEEHPA